MNAICSFRTARVAPEEADFRPALPLRSMPGSIGRTMPTMTYGDQLRHPAWQKLRLERLDAAAWKCETCGDTETTLHVHHRRYLKGRLAWEYPSENFAVLCEQCHGQAHETRSLFLSLLCLTETFPPAGITESDLLSLCHALLLSAAGGSAGWTPLLDIATPGSTRANQSGHVAARLFDSTLSAHELSDVSLLLAEGSAEYAEFKALIGSARSRIDEQVRGDLDTRNGTPP